MPFPTLSPRGATMALFFLQSLSFGGWYSRVADVQLEIGLTSAELGLAMMGSFVGAVLTYPLGPPAVDRLGTRLLAVIALPATAFGCALAPLAPNAAMLFFFLVLNGLGHGFSTIAINVEADRVEAMTGRRVMNTCNGVWSLGFVASTLIGTQPASMMCRRSFTWG